MSITVREDDIDFIQDGEQVRLRNTSEILVRTPIDRSSSVVVETEGILLTARVNSLDVSRKHARHFAAILQQPAWTADHSREPNEWSRG